MSGASGVQKRFQELLRCIPRAPLKITVPELETKLQEATGRGVGRRSLQRDLRKLQEEFPALQCKVTGREHDWFWSRDAARWDSPGMDFHTALSVRFMESYLNWLLPPVVLKHLRPYFTEAWSVLAIEAEGPFVRWQERVRIVTGELPRVAPKIPEGVPDPVYEALFKGKQLEITYQRAGAKLPSQPYLLNPLGLVLSRQVIYLVATAWKCKEVRHYALHRIREARMLMTPASEPKDFRLDEHLARGEFEVTLGAQPLTLRLSVTQAAAFYLGELPISKDQKIEADGPDHLQVTATVSDTRALRRWLLGQGDWVRVLEPRALREELAGILQRTLRGYARLPTRTASGRPRRRQKHPREVGQERSPIRQGVRRSEDSQPRKAPVRAAPVRVPARIASLDRTRVRRSRR